MRWVKLVARFCEMRNAYQSLVVNFEGKITMCENLRINFEVIAIWFRFYLRYLREVPVPVAARSKAWVCGRLPAECGFESRRLAWTSVCCECCMLSGRGLCDELITRPEESYQLWCVVCDLETSLMKRSWPALGHSAKKNS